MLRSISRTRAQAVALRQTLQNLTMVLSDVLSQTCTPFVEPAVRVLLEDVVANLDSGRRSVERSFLTVCLSPKPEPAPSAPPPMHTPQVVTGLPKVASPLRPF